ncbi:TetR family transcriptional regulator, partial [Rhodococcus sp. 06-418-1B]
MRTHGWNGVVPHTDDEAVSRILDAVREVSTTSNERPTVAAVARELGVTRQTVYRYFPDVDQLLLTAARR